ncbi:hypothetical protein SESBI_02509 [Sesbania bispinosa]|nr:hypothetical protein SESBI_02509 [Sesbania bispinosa]
MEHQPSDNPAIFGPWMLVKKAPRRKSESLNKNVDNNAASSQENQTINVNGPGNRFDILSNANDESVEPVASLHSNLLKSNTATKDNSSLAQKVVNFGSLHDSPHKFDLSSNDVPSLETKKNAKTDDWEKEALAMMSKYNNKRWEAYSSGEFVGDPFSLNKNNFFEVQGINSSASLVR